MSAVTDDTAAGAADRAMRGAEEHRIISRRCPCGTATAGKTPPGAAAPVQYGPR